jgi:hypothetical protein
MSVSLMKNQNNLTWLQALYTLNKVVALNEEESQSIVTPSTVLLFVALLLKTSPYMRGSVSSVRQHCIISNETPIFPHHLLFFPGCHVKQVKLQKQSGL